MSRSFATSPRRPCIDTLEGQCLHTGTLPSLAYGGKSCSLKMKRSAPGLNTYSNAFHPKSSSSKAGAVVRAIGFEAGEERRTYVAHVVKAIGLDAGEEHRLTWRQETPEKSERPTRQQWLDEHFFAYWYPLLCWGLNREKCKQIIADAGLPVPVKSACFFCPASKKHEIAWLQEHHPELMERAMAIERNAQAKLKTVKGLGRSFSWESFLAGQNRLSLFSDQCDCDGTS